MIGILVIGLIVLSWGIYNDKFKSDVDTDVKTPVNNTNICPACPNITCPECICPECPACNCNVTCPEVKVFTNSTG